MGRWHGIQWGFGESVHTNNFPGCDPPGPDVHTAASDRACFEAVGRPKRMKESARYILQILVFVALVLSIGTGGYLIIEDGITVGDAFYMTVTAITPTQFDEIHELSVPGRYFTVVLVFCGFGAVVAFATQFARWVIQSELEGVGVITRKQMRRRISRMREHYIVCGYGKIGGAICKELKDHQLPFVVITDDEASIAAVEREGFALVRGNPTADTTLKEAAIERAQGVIAVLTDDSNNLFISLAARELNPKIFIIARGEDSGVEDRILRAGADIVVSPMKLGGRQIAELIKQQADSSSVVTGVSEHSSLLGVSLKPHRHDAEQATTVDEILNESTAVGVAGIQRCDGTFDPTPPPETAVHQGDTVILVTRTSQAGDSFNKPPSGKTILLADDHRALRLLFTRKLAAAGHDVIQAANGDDALAMARATTPDLIVLDVNMPARDGYQVCHELRQSKQFATTPIILYSGNDTAEFAQRGRAAGANTCVRKTSKSSELLASIEAIFSERQQDRDAEDRSERPREGSSSTESATVSEGPPPHSRPFDFETAMENAGGDEELLSELITAMEEETPRMMNEIQTAVAATDYKSLERAAHALKGSLVVFGADEASEAATQLEIAARQQDASSIERLTGNLQTQIAEVTRALQQHARSLARID
ncbi:Sensor protein EvgS precursor [Stieleria magnilauensis]|uniref:Sensor protein EvgS n=2 Tax=Stieleria magnilauensis TaxID=2527963 RepID=A0ABX5XXK4_9BACT|nr:Sensor protein EvgS precursor [Planctomycetes bacterium TBK1r]